MLRFTLEQWESPISVLEPYVGLRVLNMIEQRTGATRIKDLSRLTEREVKSWPLIGQKIYETILDGLYRWYEATRQREHIDMNTSFNEQMFQGDAR